MSEEYGVQKKDYTGSYTIYQDTILLECRYHNCNANDFDLFGLDGVTSIGMGLSQQIRCLKG